MTLEVLNFSINQNDSSLLQDSNILDILVTLDVVHLSPTIISTKLRQEWNIEFISLTLFVSQLVKSNDSILVLPANILCISTTFDVTKLSQNTMFFSEVFVLNIQSIYNTFVVSKFDKSSVSNDLQAQNISLIDVTLLVLNLLKSRDFSLLQSSNILVILVTQLVFQSLISRSSTFFQE